MPITEQEAEMLRYFHHDKGDVTAYCEWERLVQENPELGEEHRAMKRAARTFATYLDNLLEQATL